MFTRAASLRFWLLVAMIASAVIGLAAAVVLFNHVQNANEHSSDAAKAHQQARMIAAQGQAGADQARLAALQELLGNDQITVERGGQTIFQGPRPVGRELELKAEARFPGGMVRIAYYSSPGASTTLDLTLITAGVLALVIAAAIVAATLVTRAVRVPLERAIRAAEWVSRGDFTARMGTSGPEELVKLGGAFDDMAARLDQADRDQRQFLADVAHEIATPVNAVSGFALALADGAAQVEQGPWVALPPVGRPLVSESPESGIGETAGMTSRVNRRERPASREWASEAVRRIEADENRSADTHLHTFPLPSTWGIDLYLKDESVHPTGSLKHRLARSLFLYGLCNGWIAEGTTIVDASSGSTAVSEAYFARFLALPFVAVMPASTSPEKIGLIEAEGGSCRLVDDPTKIVAEAQQLAAESDGHFLDQFTYAERAIDWQGNNHIAESIFSQMSLEAHPIPAWVVLGAGTGGTSATVGRYTRLKRYPTQLCIVDPPGSIFYSHWTGDPSTFTGRPSLIEGIGRQQVEPSFLADVIDRMVQVPDAASIATMRLVQARSGRSVGGSTGTNVWGAFLLAAEMLSRGQPGSIVTLICDGGERYGGTYYSDEWVREQGLNLAPYTEALETFLADGPLVAPPSPDLPS